MGNIKVDTIELPAHWAPIYINDDTSGMDADEIDAADAALKALQRSYPGARIVDCSEDTHFARYDGLGRDIAEYTFHYDAPAAEPTEEPANEPTAPVAAPAEQYRIRIVVDCEPYEHGDYADGKDEQAALDAIAEHGVWGFVVEKWVDATPGHACKACGHAPDAMSEGWEHVDSCFGFIGNYDDYMMSQALESIPEGYGEVSIVDEHGREINTVTR